MEQYRVTEGRPARTISIALVEAVDAEPYRAPRSTTVGALDGAPEQVFGEIGAVAVAAGGRIAIADSRLNEVRLFSQDGSFLQRLGRSGAGPGEYRRPLSLVSEADTLWIGDLNRRVHAYVREGDSLVYDSSFPTAIAPRGMCRMGGSLFIHGTNAESPALIHRYDDGIAVSSFGELYRSPSPIINHQISLGHIACVPSRQVIAIAPSGPLGEVRGYGPDGALLWRTRLGDFRPVRLQAKESGYEVSFPVDGFDSIYSLVASDRGTILVQVASQTHQSQSAGGEYARLVTLELDAANGSGRVLGTRFPRIGVDGAARHVLIEQLPFPSVTYAAGPLVH